MEGLDLAPANKVLGVVGTAQAQGEAAGAGAETQAQEGPAEADAAEGEEAAALPPLPYQTWQCGGGYAELSPRAEMMSLDLAGPVVEVQGAVQLQLQPSAVQAGSGVSQQGAEGMSVDGSGQTASSGSGSKEIHALVLWLDWDLTPRWSQGSDAAGVDRGQTSAAGTGRGSARSGQGSLVVDNGPCAQGGPRPTWQGVMLLPEPLRVPKQQDGAGEGSGGRLGGPAHAAGTAAVSAAAVLHVGARFDPEDGGLEVEVGWE